MDKPEPSDHECVEVIIISDDEGDLDEEDATSDDSDMSANEGEAPLQYTPADDTSSESSSTSNSDSIDKRVFARATKRALTAWKARRPERTHPVGELLLLEIHKIPTAALSELGVKILNELAERTVVVPPLVDLRTAGAPKLVDLTDANK
jgi:hypothetical protein